MLNECAWLLPKHLLPFCPCPPWQQRAAWQQIPQFWRERAVLRGEKLLGGKWEFLPISSWLQFTRTGKRAPYEAVYFARRRQLADLVMAECCEGQGRFMNDILDGIYALLGETAWWLPAHNSYLRDTPQLALPDTTRPILELFSAETAALLAMVYYLLREKLEESTQKAICKALQERIFTPYLQEDFWWMDTRQGSLCNWTPWCTQNVLLAAFCTPLPEQQRQQIVRKAVFSLNQFLDGYGEDGCCDEGAQYYGHAALALFGALEVLEAAAPGVFAPVYQQEKIKNMAAYILHVHVAGRYYINFADCSPIAGRRGAAEYLFAKRVGNHAMQAFAAEDYRAGLAEEGEAEDIARINLWQLTLEVFTAREMLNCPEEKKSSGTVYYPSVGLFIAHDETYTLAAKAGNNADSHNHNDTGSITLYKNGAPFIIDLGVETYTGKTFSEKRYEIWTMQSAWHNLPTFAGVMQNAGKQYAAQKVQVALEEEKSGISMDMAPAYPPAAKVGQYLRTVHLCKGKGVVIKDVTDYAGNVTLTLLLSQKPMVEGNGRIAVGELGSILAQAASEIQVEEVTITDARLRIAWPPQIYRLLITFNKKIEIIIQ